GIRRPGIHVLGVGGKNDLSPIAGDEFKVSVKIARIVRVVLITVKLQWVDEHRGDHEVVFGSGLFKERAVSLVQGAHGWYEADCWRWVTCGNEFSDFVSDLGFSSGGRGGQLSLFKCHDT